MLRFKVAVLSGPAPVLRQELCVSTTVHVSRHGTDPQTHSFMKRESKVTGLMPWAGVGRVLLIVTYVASCMQPLIIAVIAGKRSGAYQLLTFCVAMAWRCLTAPVATRVHTVGASLRGTGLPVCRNQGNDVQH